MGRFKPNVAYTNKDNEKIHLVVNTYAEIKKDLRKYLNDSDGMVNVYRSKRGQWGEWFEHWETLNNKPRIFKEGWS